MDKKTGSTQQLKNRAWLLQGLFNSLPGVIQLKEKELSFIAHGTGTLSRKRLKALEDQVRQPGLSDKLDRGGHARVLRVPVERIEQVVFPWYYFQGGMVIDIDGISYRFSFIEPQNAKMPTPMGREPARDLSTARQAGKHWKESLSVLTRAP